MFPSPNYSWIRDRKQKKLRINLGWKNLTWNQIWLVTYTWNPCIHLWMAIKKLKFIHHFRYIKIPPWLRGLRGIKQKKSLWSWACGWAMNNAFLLSYRVLKCDVIKKKFLKLWDLSGYSERTMSKRPTWKKWAFRGKFSLRS